MVYIMWGAISNSLGDMSWLKYFPLFGHNFLMRHPDSIGQRRKKLGIVRSTSYFKKKEIRFIVFKIFTFKRFTIHGHIVKWDEVISSKTNDCSFCRWYLSLQKVSALSIQQILRLAHTNEMLINKNNKNKNTEDHKRPPHLTGES